MMSALVKTSALEASITSKTRSRDGEEMSGFMREGCVFVCPDVRTVFFFRFSLTQIHAVFRSLTD